MRVGAAAGGVCRGAYAIDRFTCRRSLGRRARAGAVAAARRRRSSPTVRLHVTLPPRCARRSRLGMPVTRCSWLLHVIVAVGQMMRRCRRCAVPLVDGRRQSRKHRASRCSPCLWASCAPTVVPCTLRATPPVYRCVSARGCVLGGPVTRSRGRNRRVADDDVERRSQRSRQLAGQQWRPAADSCATSKQDCERADDGRGRQRVRHRRVGGRCASARCDSTRRRRQRVHVQVGLARCSLHTLAIQAKQQR